MPKYYRPTTRADALAALAEGGERARPLVGGTDLLVGLRHHTLEPDLLVDLKAVTDLSEPIVVTDDGVRIGATYTLGDLVGHPVIREWYPALVEAALTVGSVAIRNRASLVANSCNASPAADTAPPLLVHDARVTIASLDGDRTASLDEFFLGPRRTLCGPGELVARIDLPRPAPGSGSAFRRLTRRRGVDLATVSVAARVGRDGGLVLGMGAVGPRPLRTESPGPVDLADASARAAALDRLVSVATPISDVRGSREYRLATLRVLTERAVLAAADRRNTREEAP
jgi:CO/xanthine dehydrogenase FAD-binding subunit